MKIGEVIRKRRRSMGMTLEALAAHAGTDAAGLSRVERGLQNYTPAGLAAIAEALGITVSAITAEAEEGNADVLRVIDRPVNDEQELLNNYRRLRGSARSVASLVIAEMAKSARREKNNHP